MCSDAFVALTSRLVYLYLHLEDAVVIGLLVSNELPVFHIGAK